MEKENNQSEVKIDLKTNYFGKIVLLNLAERNDRYNGIADQLKKYFKFDDITVHTSCLFPHNDALMLGLKAKNFNFSKPNEVGCALEHYRIIKTAFLQNCQHLLMMEDDICFYDNVNYIKEVLDHMPKDYDIIQFGGFCSNPDIRNNILGKQHLISKHRLTNYGYQWDSHNYFVPSCPVHPEDRANIRLWCTSMYALSRRGMEYYIKYMDTAFTVADMPFYMAVDNQNIVKHYITTVPLVIQTSKKACYSDIRDASNDSIDYDKNNCYEQNINRKSYNDPWQRAKDNFDAIDSNSINTSPFA